MNVSRNNLVPKSIKINILQVYPLSLTFSSSLWSYKMLYSLFLLTISGASNRDKVKPADAPPLPGKSKYNLSIMSSEIKWKSNQIKPFRSYTFNKPFYKFSPLMNSLIVITHSLHKWLGLRARSNWYYNDKEIKSFRGKG